MKKNIVNFLFLFFIFFKVSSVDSVNFSIGMNKAEKETRDRLRKCESKLSMAECKVSILEDENKKLRKIIDSNPLAIGIKYYQDQISEINREIDRLRPGFIIWVKSLFKNQDENKKRAKKKIEKYEEFKKAFKDSAIEFVETSVSSSIKVLAEQGTRANHFSKIPKINNIDLKKELIEIEKSTIISLIRKIEIEKLKLLSSFAEL